MALAVVNVVFDLDGTLVDSAPGIERCLTEALAEVAPGRPSGWPEGLIGPPVRDMVAQLLPDADAATLDCAVASFRRCYDGGGWSETIPYPGAGVMLRTLREAGCRLFIVTNKPAVPTASILADLGWDVLFDRVVCRDSVFPPFADKPAAFSDLIESESLEGAETLFVGDTGDDAAAARASDVPFVFAAYGYGEPAAAEQASATIDAPAALVGLVGVSAG